MGRGLRRSWWWGALASEASAPTGVLDHFIVVSLYIAFCAEETIHAGGPGLSLKDKVKNDQPSGRS